jgi:hypothetical protein
MATEPTDRILDWASGGSTTDPGGSKEAAGWLTSERIPANWWNWILNSFGQWLTYLRDRPHIHYMGVLTLGGSPSAANEAGDSVASFADSGDTILVNLTTGVADTAKTNVQVSAIPSTAYVLFSGTLLSTTQIQIAARDTTSAGASIDLNTGSWPMNVVLLDNT